jgi:hypothetical protein
MCRSPNDSDSHRHDRDYVLLASDRQLTFIDGANKGKVAEDNACKLVSFLHLFGIGYSGPSRLERKATHEWIATTIAAAGARNVDEATRASRTRQHRR